MTNDKTAWSYLAALYDGEGCIHIARQFQNKSNCYGYRLDMPISMSSLAIMKWLISHFGGVYYTKSRDTRYTSTKQMYQWGPKGKANKEKLLLGILPYLVEKVEQAKVALEFLRTEWGTGEQKDKPHFLLRSLKRESVETNTSDSEKSEKREPELLSNQESELAVTQVS